MGGDFLNGECRGAQHGLGLVEEIFVDDLLRRLTDGSLRHLRQVARRDGQLISIETDVVSCAVVSGDETEHTVVEGGGTLMGFCSIDGIDHLSVDVVVSVAYGSEHIVAQSQTCGDGRGESTAYTVALPAFYIIRGEELFVLVRMFRMFRMFRLFISYH